MVILSPIQGTFIIRIVIERLYLFDRVEGGDRRLFSLPLLQHRDTVIVGTPLLVFGLVVRILEQMPKAVLVLLQQIQQHDTMKIQVLHLILNGKRPLAADILQQLVHCHAALPVLHLLLDVGDGHDSACPSNPGTTVNQDGSRIAADSSDEVQSRLGRWRNAPVRPILPLVVEDFTLHGLPLDVELGDVDGSLRGRERGTLETIGQ